VANTPKALYRDLLTDVTNTNVATVPADKRWVLTNLILTNWGTVPANAYVQLGHVPLVHQYALSPGATFALDCSQVIGAGIPIRAWASPGNNIAMHASGVEMDV
jgi:hypothetical protein